MILTTKGSVVITVAQDGPDVAIKANGIDIAYVMADGTIRAAYRQQADKEKLEALGFQFKKYDDDINYRVKTSN